MSTYSITGLVATTPRYVVTETGLRVISFRLADSSGKDTNWFTITAFGELAENVSNSINKGDRVLVIGELRIRDWDNGDRSGTSVEVEASAIGHNLEYGTASFERTPVTTRPAHNCDCGMCQVA